MSAKEKTGETRPPLFLAGPTAVGKSEVAMHLAQQLRGEIISVDSMQVYRGLDIGTGKPSFTDRQRVRHHLVDILDLNEGFTAGQFVERAQRAMVEIQERGGLPILCGGTGLYFKSLLEGLSDLPAADAALRAELERTPIEELRQELELADSAMARQIDGQNPRRVIRAIEIIRVTGKPVSQQRTRWHVAPTSGPGPVIPSPGEGLFIGLDRPVEELRERIDVRVDRMFGDGLVAETRALLDRGLEQNRTAMQAIGYRQTIEYVRGQRSLAETVALVKLRTRQYAKRQRTWFRHQTALAWMAVGPTERPEDVAQRLAERYRQFA